MYTDLLNIGLGFLEGLALIVSPCILPILPIVLASSLTGKKKRPFGIVVGFVFVFSLFTFFSRKLVEYSGLDLNLIRHLAYFLLLLLGVIMLSSYLSDRFTALTQSFSRIGSSWRAFNRPQEDFLSGVLIGSLIALIWTPCAGPILAAVIVQTVIQKTSLNSFLILLAFTLGAAGPMLLLIIFGRKLMAKLRFFSKHAPTLRKILGLVIIAAVGYMIYAETNIQFATNAETVSDRTEQAPTFTKSSPASAIDGIDAWINSGPIILSSLKGKVVLIDFWTYSCINCIRTLPYVRSWYQKYHEQGLEIIGIHTPEFDFEKDLANVKAAVKKYDLPYPIALDNNFVTWRNFDNQYWPAHYLIDKNGQVVYTHFGEGEYETTENNIRALLGLNAVKTAQDSPQPTAALVSPETYLGYERGRLFSSGEKISKDKVASYHFPAHLKKDAWALAGKWVVHKDRIIADEKNAALKMHFQGHKVFIVMGKPNTVAMSLKILLNGKPLVNNPAKDVKMSRITVNEHRLYEVVVLPKDEGGELQLTASEPGLELYTLTFGN